MLEDKILEARILIVDDQISNVELLEQVLTLFKFSTIKAITDPRLFFETYENYKPDIILLDLMMPHISGLEILSRYQKEYPKENHVPIIVLTSDITAQTRENALSAGARDFLNKPFDIHEIYHRMYNLLEMRFLYLELELRNKELENEVARQTSHLSNVNQQLEKANRELRMLEEAKLQFLKIISHEIRTPLNGIKGFAEVIKFSIDAEPVLEYFEYLEKSVERLESFSHQALLLAELRSGTYKLKITEVNPVAVISDFIKKNNAKIVDKKLRIKGIDSIVETKLKSDNELFKYLILTVLQNAIKYAFEETIINISTISDERTMSIKVSDTGPDLPPDITDATELPIFGLSQKHIDKNTGLDIVLCHLIMQTLHGQISFENSKPSGVTVTMTFPL